MLDNLKKYKVILASNSPRRKELLSGLGVDYEIRTLPDVDESYPDTLRGADIPLYIAKEKANAYRNMLQSGELMITADTIVSINVSIIATVTLTVNTHTRCCELSSLIPTDVMQIPIYGISMVIAEYTNNNLSCPGRNISNSFIPR